MKTGLRSAVVWALAATLACGCSVQSESSEGTTGDESAVVIGGDVIHRAQGVVSDLRTILVPGSNVRIATWNETLNGVRAPYFAIDLGRGWNAAKKTSYQVPLRARSIDPLVEIQSITLEQSGVALHVVQYVAQPLEPFWSAIRGAGGEVFNYLHGNAQLVRGDSAAIARIAALPFVRAVTPLHAFDRVDPAFTRRDAGTVGVVAVLVDPVGDRAVLESKIAALGGKVTLSDRQGILVEAEMPASALTELSRQPQVLWLEESGEMEYDYDIARQQGGAEFLEALEDRSPDLPGYTGIGIRGHILEGIDPNHPDFAANGFRGIPVAIDAPQSDSHGMQTFGIVFGSGAGNARAKGTLPNGQGYYTNNKTFVSGPEGGRSTLVGKLIAEHKVMFQTASWGNPTIKTYTAKSAEMDALILKHDIPITQSQSNTGSQTSRPQAWAKNIISVGALNHLGTLTMDDDKWNRSGSIGPAADGGIKPDLCFYYDKTITTSLNNGYSQSFGGTSGATPTVAGHVGLAIELWTNGVFGNELIPTAAGEEIADFRFKNRPHAMTTKALLINTAKQYAFEGETHDKTRTHQGWGFPDVANLYKRRNNMLVVNESEVVKSLDTRVYSLEVAAGSPEFHATLVYADKEAAVPATIHRVNNIDLKVTAPDGTVYWGNNGLKAGNYSTSGGEHNVLDTVENVIVAKPQAGTWKVEVIADEINADTHAETPDVDADFALVVSSAPAAR